MTKKKLIIIQDSLKKDNKIPQDYWSNMILVGNALVESYEIEQCILVYNNQKDYDNALVLLENPAHYQIEIESSKFDCLLNRFYNKHQEIGSIYIALDNIEDTDTVILCCPSKCFVWNENDELTIDSSGLEIIKPSELEDYEELLAKKIAELDKKR